MLLSEVTLNRLKTQHVVLKVLISVLCESELMQKPIPDKWSINENVAHLTCYQPRVIARTKMILREENPSFESYIPENDAEFSNFLGMSIEELLIHQKQKREELVNLISNLSDEQLKRTGTHAKFGKMNLIEWTEFFLLHEAHHQHTIFKLVRSIKK